MGYIIVGLLSNGIINAYFILIFSAFVIMPWHGLYQITWGTKRTWKKMPIHPSFIKD